MTTTHLAKLRGASAYEIAVRNGFEGTEQQWLASITPTPAAIDARIKQQQGAAGGLASLDQAGRVPETELPARLAEAALSGMIDGRITAHPGLPSGSAFAGPVDVVINGDSYSAGGQTDPAEGRVIPYGELASEYLGIAVLILSVAGERMGDIGVRQGGTLLQFTVPGGVIPAGTEPFAVTLTSLPSSEFVGGGPDNQRSRFLGTFLGVTVTVLYSGGVWTMARATAATVAKPVPASGGKFRILVDRANRDAVHIFFGGRNGGNVLARMAEMVQFLGHDRFVVMPPLTGGADSGPSSAHAQLQGAYPAQFFDMRGYMIAHGLGDEGITPTAQDQDDISRDTVPTSLRVPGDNIHPNAAGQRVMGRRLSELLIERALVKSGATFVPPRVTPLPSESFAAILDLPTSSAYAATGLSSAAREAQGFSLRVRTRFDAIAGTQQFARRNVAAGNRAWHAYLLASGVLRLQFYNAADSVTTVDSAAGSFTAGELVDLRIDVNTATRVVRFFRATDFATWTQIGSDSTGAASSLANVAAPLEIGRFAGEVHRAVLLSFDGSTTFIDEDFDSPLPSSWSLNGGAALVASS